MVTGCSSLDISELFPKSEETKTVYRPGGNAIRAFALSGSGSVEYMCTSDEKGTFYKFINMNIFLKDKSGKTVGPFVARNKKLNISMVLLFLLLNPFSGGQAKRCIATIQL